MRLPLAPALLPFTPTPVPRSLWRDPIALLSVTAATFASLTMTGFEFGISNNVFHLPYVLRLAERPAFLHDAFYLSLNKFTSLAFPLLRAVSDETNVAMVFRLAHGLGRWAAFAALLGFYRCIGITAPSSMSVALMASAVTPWLLGTSLLGEHGLFVAYFTHSELTWGPALAAMVAMRQGKPSLSAGLAGLSFCLNAFVGIWMAWVLAMTVLADGARRRDWRQHARTLTIFAVACSPVAIWIASAVVGGGEAAQFSYVDFTRQYFPVHFLAEAMKLRNLRDLVVIAACGALSATHVVDARYWLAALSASIALLVGGAALPYAIDDRFVVNLHLMRSGGLVQFLSIALTLAFLVRVVCDRQQPLDLRVVGTIALGAFLTPEADSLFLLVGALGVALIWSTLALQCCTHASRLSAAFHVARPVVMAALAVGLAYGLYRGGVAADALVRWGALLATLTASLIADATRVQFLVGAIWVVTGLTAGIGQLQNRSVAEVTHKSQTQVDFIQMTDWVRQSDIPGPILFPVEGLHARQFDMFQLATRKPVWVDWKQGAAVLWEPSFYWQWMPRYQEVRELRTPAQFGDYAKRCHVEQLVLPADVGRCPSGSRQLMANHGFAVCDVR